VFPRRRKVVLVHGCFWHQHPGCSLARQPKSRLDYWLPKLARNAARDAEAHRKLTDLGWKALVVWECETKHSACLKSILRSFLLEEP
jgi:DNA mismatch endonuclease (patch repair protein)